jgi:hypothetical protein
MNEMEVIVANIAGGVRKEIFSGREYIVAPLSLIVPGVLNGSKGSLYYPVEELRKEPSAWNGMPIVVNHPTKNGKPVSARDPRILERYGIGTVFNTGMNGKLGAEGWFEVEATRRVDARVLDALTVGRPLELSTGLFTDNESAPPDAVFNSPSGPRPYKYIARNYRPDHLAILPDGKGACSINDGCGVLVNDAFLGLILLTNAYNPKQARVPAGQKGGGRFASVAGATSKVASAERRVAKARLTLEKAKAALKVEQNGLVVAKRGLAEAKSRKKGESPAAKGAISKASSTQPVDVQKHVNETKRLSAEGMEGKYVRKRGEKWFIPKVSNEEFHGRVSSHFATLDKSLNREQVHELVRSWNMTTPPRMSKKAGLKKLREAVESSRSSYLRGLE